MHEKGLTYLGAYVKHRAGHGEHEHMLRKKALLVKGGNPSWVYCPGLLNLLLLELQTTNLVGNLINPTVSS